MFEGVGGGMARQVMHTVQRHAQGPGNGFGGGEAYVNRGGEAGTGGGGHMGNIARLQARLVESDLQGGDDGIKMSSRGNFRNHTPEFRMLSGGGRESLAEQLAVADDSESGFVAGGFDAEDDGGAYCHSVIGFT